MEQRLLTGAPGQATILRPCAIHGPWSKHAREWWFVKRLLDGRTRIPLAYGGRSRFQTTSTAAITEAVLAATEGRGGHIVNVADADAPTVAEIGRAIMAELGVSADLIGLSDPSFPTRLGITPWSVHRPLVVEAEAPASGPYVESVGPAVGWLCDHVPLGNWQKSLPQLAAYPRDHFDYGLDDEGLAVPGASLIDP